MVSEETQCTEIVGEQVDGDGFHLYDSKGNGKLIHLCSVHLDPHWSEWNMGWPCPHAELMWSRSSDGKHVHMRGCRFARIEWTWADGKTLLELARLAPRLGWGFCKSCIPTLISTEYLLDAEADKLRAEAALSPTTGEE